MCNNTSAPPSSEGEYGDLNEVLDSYLTGERMVDDVLRHPDCQHDIQEVCRMIMRDADKGRELAQLLNELILRRDCEGPEMSQTRTPARSLRASPIYTRYELRAHFFISAQSLARSNWRKNGRRNKLQEVVPDPIDNFRSIKSNEADPELQYRLREVLRQLSDLPTEKQHAFECWLEGYSAQKIADILSRTGSPCTSTTVQTWLKEVLTQLRGEKVTSIRKAS